MVTLRPEQSWIAADYALYLMHSRNIWDGVAYAGTPFIPDPSNAIISPRAYPPGLPMVLVPVVALFGTSIVAAKVLNGLALSAALLAVYWIARTRLAWGWPVVLLIVCGASPAFVGIRDAIYSEPPFLVWCYLGLIAGEALRRGRRPWAMAACVFIAVAMAILTRTAGIALAAALLAAPCLLRAERRVLPIAAAGMGVVAATLLSRWLEVDSSTYLSYFGRTDMAAVQAWLVDIASAYGRAVSDGFGLQFGREANAVVLLLLLGAIAFGFFRSIRSEITEIEIFVAFYVLLLAVYPVRIEPLRYLLPVFPFLALYVLKTVQAVTARLLSAAPSRAVALLLFAMLYVPFYVAHDPLARPAIHVADTASRQMFGFMRKEIGPDEIVLARNPRVVALLADRRSAIWPEHPTYPSFWAFADQLHAGYLLEETRLDAPETGELAGIVAASGPRLRLVFENDEFRVYRILPPGG